MTIRVHNDRRRLRHPGHASGPPSVYVKWDKWDLKDGSQLVAVIATYKYSVAEDRMKGALVEDAIEKVLADHPVRRIPWESLWSNNNIARGILWDFLVKIAQIDPGHINFGRAADAFLFNFRGLDDFEAAVGKKVPSLWQ